MKNLESNKSYIFFESNSGNTMSIGGNIFSEEKIKALVENYLQKENKSKYYFPYKCTFLRTSDKNIEVYSGKKMTVKWGDINLTSWGYEYEAKLDGFPEDYLDSVYRPSVDYIFIFMFYLNLYGGRDGLEAMIKRRGTRVEK